MAEVILMPRLSDTMTEGVIADWHKKIGEPVKKGDLLAEIETDKATMELESYKDGTLLHIGTGKGGKLQVNDLLAIIGEKGEDITGLIKGSGENSAVGVEKAGGEKKETANKKSAPAKTEVTSSKTEVKKDQQPAAQQPAIDISKMEEVVLMPRLSDTMTEGIIAAWHKNVGDAVKKGDILAEVETDKATMELESYKDGKLLHIGAKQGEKIAVNELLAIIGDEKKVDVNAIVSAAKGGNASAPVASKQESGKTSAPVSQQTTQQKSEGSEQDNSSGENGRIKASPLAKKLAAEKGIDISRIHGTGDGGRITKADIDNYRQETTAQPTQKEGTSKSDGKGAAPARQTISISNFIPGEEGYTDINNSQIRKTIARRLTESKFSAPHFYLTMEISMDNAIQSRTQLNEMSPVKISFNDMIVKAAAMALRQHPAVNVSWKDDFIRQYKHIHIGVAVAIEEGLIVPVIRFADQKSLSQIAAESKELSGRARNKKLQPQEFTGNTFTISNLGMMDIDEFTAIINPPDSCIMAVGRIKEVVVRKGDGFGVSNVMKITLSCDHRSVDGALGAAFLQTFKKYLENPVTMLI